MPANTQTVSLDQAKDWARRLQKTVPALSKLSTAQEAVAKMLGHASWHAMTAFYDKQASISSGLEAADAPSGPAHPFDEMMASCLRAINAKYPGVEAVRVEVLAHETDEMEGSADEVLYAAEELEREKGMFLSDAIAQVLEERQVRVHAPPGHLMIRVECADGRRVMTMLGVDEYRAAT